MSPLFGSREDKVAQKAQAEAEAERVVQLPVPDLAALLMPAFGPDGPGRGSRHEVNLLQVANWLMRSFPQGTKYLRVIDRPVREAIQALENAGLVQRLGQASVGSRFRATRLGEDSLADGSVREKLG